MVYGLYLKNVSTKQVGVTSRGFLHEVATNRLFYFYRGLSNIVRIGNCSLILTWHRIWLMVKGQISGAIVIKKFMYITDF